MSKLPKKRPKIRRELVVFNEIASCANPVTSDERRSKASSCFASTDQDSMFQRVGFAMLRMVSV